MALRFRRAGPSAIERTPDEVTAEYLSIDRSTLGRLIAEIDGKLDEISRRPLPAAAAQQVLAATPAEVRPLDEGRSAEDVGD